MAKRRRGYVPPYKRLIQADPLFGQLGADLSAQGVASEAKRSADTRTSLAGFGDFGNIGDSLSSLGLDPSSPLARKLVADAQAAQQPGADLTSAGLSTSAGLAWEHQQGLEQLRARNAVRGIRSGATGIGLANEGQRYSGAQYDVRTKLTQYLAGVHQAFADSEQKRQGELATGATAAAGRVGSLFPSVAGAPAPQPPASPMASLPPGVLPGGAQTATAAPGTPAQVYPGGAPSATAKLPTLAHRILPKLNLLQNRGL